MFGRPITALLVFFVLGPSVAWAQTERGSIVGIVRDATGGVLPGATVTVTNTQTGAQQSFVTNSQGLYDAPFLVPGSYRVSAALSGFATATIEEVEVNIGLRANADLTMKPATVTTEVTVLARPPLVQQETATVGQVFDSRTLIALPSTDGNIYNLARFIAPGRVVCQAPFGPDDPNADVLEEIALALGGMTDAHGRKLDVVRIPSPGIVLDEDGDAVAASHMNFLIGNSVVVVPTYSASAQAAVDALKPLFPGRKIIGLPSRAILTGGGSFHCITQQEPS